MKAVLGQPVGRIWVQLSWECVRLIHFFPPPPSFATRPPLSFLRRYVPLWPLAALNTLPACPTVTGYCLHVFFIPIMFKSSWTSSPKSFTWSYPFPCSIISFEFFFGILWCLYFFRRDHTILVGGIVQTLSAPCNMSFISLFVLIPQRSLSFTGLDILLTVFLRNILRAFFSSVCQ